jgi:hypothetical protein
MCQLTTATERIRKVNKRIRVVQGGTSASKTVSIFLDFVDRAQRDKIPTHCWKKHSQLQFPQSCWKVSYSDTKRGHSLEPSIGASVAERTNSWLDQFRRLLVGHQHLLSTYRAALLHRLLLDYAETLFMKYALASCGFAALICVQYPGDLGQQRAQGEWFFQQFGIMMKDAVIVDQIVVVA